MAKVIHISIKDDDLDIIPELKKLDKNLSKITVRAIKSYLNLINTYETPDIRTLRLIIKKDPSKKEFLENYIKRVESLLKE